MINKENASGLRAQELDIKNVGVSKLESGIFPENKGVNGKLAEIGVEGFDVLKKMMSLTNMHPDKSFFSLDRYLIGESAIEDFLDQANAVIHKVEIDYPKRIYTIRELTFLLTVLSVFLPLWREHTKASDTMEHFMSVTRNKVEDFVHQRWFGRLFGCNWIEFSELLPDHGAQLKQELMLNYPISIVSSLELNKFDADDIERFGLKDPVVANNLHLLSAPFELGAHKDVCEWEFVACDHSEIYHANASANTKHHIPIFCGDKFIGALKMFGAEYSFLAVRGVVKDGKPVLVKGGIYQFHGVRFDKNSSRVDLNDYQRINILPLRMWHDRDERVAGTKDTFKKRTLDEVVQNYVMLYGAIE